MSAEYEESVLTDVQQKSPGASFGSLNDVTNHDVDELLSALEETTNEPEFLKGDDDEFVKNMLMAEKPVPFTAQQEIDEVLGASLPSLSGLGGSLPSLGGLEPLGLDEIPSDPNLLASLAMDLEFQQNSLRLDDYVMKSNLSDPTDIGKALDSHEAKMESEIIPTTANLYPEMPYEPSTMSSATGKRRRVPRRGSLPSMHLNYEDPYEPTPISMTSGGSEMQPGDEPPTKLAAVPMGEETTSEPSAGGRRRAQRRGSLPSMHLHYDAAVPTPTVDVLVNEHGEAVAPREDDNAPRSNGRMQRRGSTGSHFGGSMSFGGDSTFNFGSEPTQSGGRSKTEEDILPEYPPRKQGRMPRRGSTGSQFGGSMAFGESSHFNFGGETATSVQEGSEQNGNDEQMPKFGRMQRRGSTGSQFGGMHLGIGDVSTTVPENLDPEKMMIKLQNMMKKSLGTQKALQKWDKDNGLPKSHSQTMVNTSRSRKQLQDGIILPKWDGSPLISQETELGKPKPRARHHKEEGGKMKRRMSAPASSALY